MQVVVLNDNLNRNIQSPVLKSCSLMCVWKKNGCDGALWRNCDIHKWYHKINSALLVLSIFPMSFDCCDAPVP